MSSDDSPQPAHAGLRRFGGGLLAVLVGLAAVVGLLVFLNSRDEAGVDPAGDAAAKNVPGQVFDAPQRYLDAAQLRGLAAGNVYLVTGDARAPAGLVALRDQLSGPPDPVLEQSGQAVVLVQKPGTDGVVALAHGRRLESADPADPRLESFAAHWLGRSGD